MEIKKIIPNLIGSIITVAETKKTREFILNEVTIKNFSDYMKKYQELYKYLADIVKKNIFNKKKKPIIVDLGCGPGLLSKELIEEIPKAKIIGVDPSKDMIDIANKNTVGNNFETRIGSSEVIPVSNATIDIVVSRFSLEYWEKPKKSFIEINRVLKPGGRVILECLNKDFPRWKLFLIEINMFFKSVSSDVIRYHADAYKTAYLIDDVKKLLSDSGFKLISEEGSRKDWKFIVIAEKK